MIYIAALEVIEMAIYLSRAAQMPSAKLAILQWDKAFTEILVEYQDYTDVFSPDLAIELTENTGINKHAI